MASKQYTDSKMMVNRNGEEIEIDISGCIHYTVDKHYGEDADGNRGVCRTIVHEVLNIVATDSMLDTVELTKAEDEQASFILTRKFLEE